MTLTAIIILLILKLLWLTAQFKNHKSFEASLEVLHCTFIWIKIIWTHSNGFFEPFFLKKRSILNFFKFQWKFSVHQKFSDGTQIDKHYPRRTKFKGLRFFRIFWYADSLGIQKSTYKNLIIQCQTSGGVKNNFFYVGTKNFLGIFEAIC